MDRRRATVQFWDTSGQERFKSITSLYYKGAHGIILVYNTTDKQSFASIPNWMHDIHNSASKEVNCLLIGNKCDLEDQREVTYMEGKALADQLGIKFLETSGKNSHNVEQAFTVITADIKARATASRARALGKSVLPARQPERSCSVL